MFANSILNFYFIILRIKLSIILSKILKFLATEYESVSSYAAIYQQLVELKGQGLIGSTGHEFGTYLESLAATGHGSEDIVTVHGTEDQARAIPRLGTETTTYRLPAAALQTTHAHG